ncbi:MAG: hypothetical protein WBM07_10720 [Chitinivibrionales bacterium]
MFKLIIAALLFVVVGCSNPTSVKSVSKTQGLNNVNLIVDPACGVLAFEDTVISDEIITAPFYEGIDHPGFEPVNGDSIHWSGFSFQVKNDTWIDLQLYRNPMPADTGYSGELIKVISDTNIIIDPYVVAKMKILAKN